MNQDDQDEQRVAMLMKNKTRGVWARRGKVLAIFAVISLLFSLVVSTLNAAGTFRQLTHHAPGKCALVEGFVGGTEDMAPWYERGGIFISSADLIGLGGGGKIYWLPFKKGAAPQDVTPKLDFPFNPHGMDFWVRERKLFVVNHGALGADGVPTEHSIEIFDVSKRGVLTHATTIKDALLRSPNDIAATGADTFYVTNDHGQTSSTGRAVEDALRLPLGDVVYYRQGAFSVAHAGMRYANGVLYDGRALWVSQTLGRVISRFAPGEDGALELEQEVAVHTGIDNLTVDGDGAIWGGAHPKLLDFMAHAGDHAKPSPSHVVRLTGHDEQLEVRDLYMNFGTPLSGSSVAVHHEGLLFVGAVFQPAVLRCAGKQSSRP